MSSDPVIKALEKELARKQKQIGKLKEVIFANPLSRIIKIRAEANAILQEYRGDYEVISAKIGPLADEEKRMFALSKKQQNPKLIDDLVALEAEAYKLSNEISLQQIRRGR